MKKLLLEFRNTQDRSNPTNKMHAHDPEDKHPETLINYQSNFIPECQTTEFFTQKKKEKRKKSHGPLIIQQ